MSAATIRQHVVPKAEWQAGRTRQNWLYRVFCNGEPQPDAFAANAKIGWFAVWCDRDESPDLLPYRLCRGYIEIRLAPGERV